MQRILPLVRGYTGQRHSPKGLELTAGLSLMLIAVGAILRYAITVHVSGVDIPTVGLILMVVGVLGLVLSVMYMFAGSDRRRDLPPPARGRDRY